MRHFLLPLCVLSALAACEGPQGEKGPKGDPGTPGAAGPQDATVFFGQLNSPNVIGTFSVPIEGLSSYYMVVESHCFTGNAPSEMVEVNGRAGSSGRFRNGAWRVTQPGTIEVTGGTGCYYVVWKPLHFRT